MTLNEYLLFIYVRLTSAISMHLLLSMYFYFTHKLKI